MYFIGIMASNDPVTGTTNSFAILYNFIPAILRIQIRSTNNVIVHAIDSRPATPVIPYLTVTG